MPQKIRVRTFADMLWGLVNIGTYTNNLVIGRGWSLDQGAGCATRSGSTSARADRDQSQHSTALRERLTVLDERPAGSGSGV